MIDDGRVLRLGGVRNLRDVGGYPAGDGRRIRWRTLYRSDCLDQLDASGQAWLVSAGLRSVIDIRSDDELAERPNVFAASNSVAYLHFPLWIGPPPPDFEPDLREGYRREVDLLGRRFVELLEALARPTALPTVVHCAAGKDRTGVAIALILAAVGAGAGAIADDYALSQTCLGPEYITEARAWVLSHGWDWSVWEHTVLTPPERMLKTLAYIDEQYGDVAGYLREHGLSRSTLDDLREALTEPS